MVRMFSLQKHCYSVLESYMKTDPQKKWFKVAGSEPNTTLSDCPCSEAMGQISN